MQTIFSIKKAESGAPYIVPEPLLFLRRPILASKWGI